MIFIWFTLPKFSTSSFRQQIPWCPITCSCAALCIRYVRSSRPPMSLSHTFWLLSISCCRFWPFPHPFDLAAGRTTITLVVIIYYWYWLQTCYRVVCICNQEYWKWTSVVGDLPAKQDLPTVEWSLTEHWHTVSTWLRSEARSLHELSWFAVLLHQLGR